MLRSVSVVVTLLSFVSLQPCSGQSDTRADPLQDPKSPAVALQWSLYGTLLPVAAGGALLIDKPNDPEAFGLAAVVGGLVIGPALGHFYARRPGRALAGVGLRTALGVGVTAVVISHVLCDAAVCRLSGTDATILVLGAVGLLASAAFDIARAPASARHYNATHGEISVIPWLSPQQSTIGLIVRASF
jgi:hypothetical protein